MPSHAVSVTQPPTIDREGKKFNGLSVVNLVHVMFVRAVLTLELVTVTAGSITRQSHL